MTVGKTAFRSIPVQDRDCAPAFHTGAAGLPTHADVPFGETPDRIFPDIPGAETRPHFAASRDIRTGDKTALALIPDDVDAECTRLAADGVTVTNPPQDAPWRFGWRRATIRDSEGNVIHIQSFREG